MNKTPQHAEMKQFSVKDNQLLVGGIPLTQLAHRAGQTPFYAYDRQVITDRIDSLRNILPKTVHLHYAIKANSMPAVVQHLSGLTDGLDVASLGEMKTALDTGMAADKISFAGPGKTDKELTAAVAAGVTVNMESEGEMERLATIGEKLSIQPRVSVRINPDFELKTSGMKMSGGPKPFGIDAERVPDVLQRIGQLELGFQGFHIFSGSQNLRPEALIEAQTNTFELAYRMAEYAPSPVTWLNIGGGFGIPYFPGEKPLDLQPVADNLLLLTDTCKKRLPEAEIVIELGRYLVGEAGVYVCEVMDKKISRGETFVVTNGGLHHHLAASGNFGQVIRKNYPVCVGNKMASEKTETVNIVGPLCTPLDILANKMELPEVSIGDLIVIYQSGAYGLSASPLGFLSHPETIEVII
ncbi:MAG: pyridoxal-dependent decarboxylase, exosortase A system-associated [Sedimenticola sp.]|nr:pyridoxal-dependent decarboxylase, exosortase A system-associated [Sedimenticola sp.]